MNVIETKIKDLLIFEPRVLQMTVVGLWKALISKCLKKL